MRAHRPGPMKVGTTPQRLVSFPSKHPPLASAGRTVVYTSRPRSSATAHSVPMATAACTESTSSPVGVLVAVISISSAGMPADVSTVAICSSLGLSVCCRSAVSAACMNACKSPTAADGLASGSSTDGLATKGDRVAPRTSEVSTRLTGAAGEQEDTPTRISSTVAQSAGRRRGPLRRTLRQFMRGSFTRSFFHEWQSLPAM